MFRPTKIYYQNKISSQPKLLNVMQLLIFYTYFNVTKYYGFPYHINCTACPLKICKVA